MRMSNQSSSRAATTEEETANHVLIVVIMSTDLCCFRISNFNQPVSTSFSNNGNMVW